MTCVMKKEEQRCVEKMKEMGEVSCTEALVTSERSLQTYLIEEGVVGDH